ncbi:uncharacterized protein LOC111010693 [Momordica charantia]|uniref:Uncharacterized protein LOC111010693 n=1 Tax=Momordica charantia TaxID=3673 RepID=A0A6J1CGR2_MOMCH|nr:uncharacterized protein LOC111010693 [Momordica charantia]
MGCCVSTGRTSNSAAQTSRSGSSHSKINGIGSRAPPPLEEESVKEVLSETPKPKPKPPLPGLHVGSPVGERKTEKSCSGKVNGGGDRMETKIPIYPAEEISEVSDICSFSETLSTTTMTEKMMDDYEEIRQRICRSPAKLPKNRSLSDDWVPRRDRQVGKSPSRKSDQSPGRLIGGGVGAVKLVQSRDMGQSIARRSLRPEPRLPNKSENSCRRSRSPATTRTDGVASRTATGRSPSVRRSGMSPGREATTGRDCNRKEAPPAQATQYETPEGKWRTTNESLDNPLVSLECFIFL